MTQYDLVLSSAQQITQLFILRITQSLQPTSSKTTLILKEKSRTKQKESPKPSWHLRAMSSDAVSDTAGHMTFRSSFPTLPHFPICERGQKFLPLLWELMDICTAFWIQKRPGRDKTPSEGWPWQDLCYGDSHVYLILWKEQSSITTKAALTAGIAWTLMCLNQRQKGWVYKVARFVFLQSVSLWQCWFMIKWAFPSPGLGEAQVQGALAWIPAQPAVLPLQPEHSANTGPGTLPSTSWGNKNISLSPAQSEHPKWLSSSSTAIFVSVWSNVCRKDEAPSAPDSALASPAGLDTNSSSERIFPLPHHQMISLFHWYICRDQDEQNPFSFQTSQQFLNAIFSKIALYLVYNVRSNRANESLLKAEAGHYLH